MQTYLNPLMLTAAKSSLTNLIKSSRQSIINIIFEGKIFFSTVPTTLF